MWFKLNVCRSMTFIWVILLHFIMNLALETQKESGQTMKEKMPGETVTV